jgi:hypothetical protein
MYLAKLLKFVVFLAILLSVELAGAQITFDGFSGPSYMNLDRNGTATQGMWNGITVLRLTDGSSNRHPDGVTASSAWFNVLQPVGAGFTSYFKFIFHNPLQCCTPGDGLAFVIQNSSSTDSSYGATGGAKTALGVGNGGLGYAGIPNSVAIEFDTAQDPWDPTANHVAVQSCGLKTNGPVHLSGEYTIGNNHHVTSCLYNYHGQDAISSAIPPLGVGCGDGGCVDGIPVTVVVEYTPGKQGNPGELQVYVDPLLIPGTHTPIPTAKPQIDIPFTIEKVINFTNIAKFAFVGFTAGYGAHAQTTDVIAWEFTPHAPTQITEPLNDNGMENQFDFGDHVYGVTYPANSFQGSFFMTVNAMPIGQMEFYNTRLKNNTLFNNEQCIRYYSTGNSTGIDGNDGPSCIVYEVTCQDSMHNNVPCPNPIMENQLIDTRTSYSTPDPVNANNADYIKTPIGTNNWCSIFTSFMQNEIDPTTSGSGKNFSDFVATFKTGPGQDPQCSTQGSMRLISEKPQTKGAATTINLQAEPIPAGANK